jgi:hypothetical protein
VAGRKLLSRKAGTLLRIVLKRIAIILVLWTMLTGGAVFVCSSDTSGFYGGGGNRRPVAEDSFIQTRLGQSVTSTMRASDPDDDDLTYRVTSGPDVGSLSNINEDTGRFTYVPAAVGTDSFDFRANDGRADSNTATVSIAVTVTGSGAEATGLKSVLPDPGNTGLLTVLWDGPSRDLQRIHIAGVPLRSGVDVVAADPWQPHRIVGLDRDGGLFLSVDGGIDWQSVSRIAGDSDSRHLAISADRILVATDHDSCSSEQRSVAARQDDESSLDVIHACGRQPVLDTLGGAWVVREGWVRHATSNEPLLGPSVYQLAADQWRQARLLALKTTDAGRVGLWESNDGGENWQLVTDEIPAGLPTGLLISPVTDGLLYVAVWNPSGTSIHRWRPGDRTWQPLGIMSGSRAKLFHCAAHTPCLLSEDGARLLRFRDDADNEKTG